MSPEYGIFMAMGHITKGRLAIAQMLGFALAVASIRLHRKIATVSAWVAV